MADCFCYSLLVYVGTPLEDTLLASQMIQAGALVEEVVETPGSFSL